MELLHDYAKGIIVVSVLAILLENILPEAHYKKYINITIGLVVMLVIVNPLTNLPHYRAAFVLPEMVIDDADLSEEFDKELVREEFSSRLSETISDEVEIRCGRRVSVWVDVSYNDSGEITGIDKIFVSPIDEEIRAAVSACTGVAQEQIEGGEKR